MNLLGMYLLMSMLFVFGAMVEFTVVLIEKQIAESQYLRPKSTSYDMKTKTGGEKGRLGILCRRRKVGENRKNNVETEKKKKHEYRNTVDFLMKMPRVMKIDFAAFLLFNVLFFVCNLGYFAYSYNY